MLKQLFRNLKRLTQHETQVDPSRFNDPVAMHTKWTPAKGGGTNMCTHRLTTIGPNRVEIKSTIGVKIFAAIFLIIGLAVGIGVGIAGDGEERLFALILGGIFALTGAALLYYYSRPIVFDKTVGWFYKGKKAGPDLLRSSAEPPKDAARLSDIHALQIISEYCTSRGKNHTTHYYSYELNIVQKDGRRINVVDHGKLDKLTDDANALAAFLGVPLWNAEQQDEYGLAGIV
ncbi:hypothetical protein STSP2_00376 [Anaerohalosphaera lusitana]|uniref:Uncharacterized protein n=1 Tax=Anaerohalosphaera lusitana TaxID=1936003 RepID=A0A1U9NH23_9BACT|nr:SoxR reducing system RseC family protein [Anaerohalosphaera lusitana]AQT67233.1 hypothetical protein STSP2_00376 [Anaerohalosphaera lusitana]